MASGSNTTNDGTNNNVDSVPPFTLNIGDTVLMPADNAAQPIPGTDGKQSQNAPGKSAANPQPNSPRVSKTVTMVDALRETIRTVNEQNTRIRALEDGQRQILGYFKPYSPPRRAERSKSPPARRVETSQRRPVLEHVQPPPQKRNRTPPREDAVARATKRGKVVAYFEQRPRSPPRRKQLLLGGMTHGSREDDYHHRRENSPRAMAWYRSLPQGSITSWIDLCKQFTSHFTASRKHPKTEANLEVVVQGPNETLRSYIERFNKEAVQVDVTDNMKKYLMRKNLRDGTKFKEMVAIEKPATWNEILYKAQAYMQFEEETMADAMRYSRTEDNLPPREQGNKNGDKCNGDRRGHDKSREPRGPHSQFTNYTPLLVPREIVLAECASSDFKNAGIKFQKSTPYKPGQDRSRHCAYHKSYGHLTEDCIQLKDAIEILIRNGKLKDYVKRKENPCQEKKREDTPEDEPKSSREKKKFPETMVVSGGVFDKHTIGSVKRKFEELITASSGMDVTLDKPKTSSQPLSFYLEELPGGSANSQIPLLVRADMANFDVRRILVDSGSSCNIMYAHLFRTLQLDESHLTPYLGSDLQGFKSIKVKFLVVVCPSLYQCIIGRTAITDLPAVASTDHLKMKYYTNKGQVATLYGDIEAARRCFNAAYKGRATLVIRHSKQEHKEEKKLRKEKKEDDAASKENLRPIPDGDFELIPLGDDPSRNLKIGKDVPDLARKQLLTIDEVASAVVQRRRRQSPEKMETAEKVVKDLLEANFISEAKYTTWLSNVVIVKKSNGKWRMCVDYTDLNRACPKDAYPLPCIDRLVDNSSGFKLLSFLDAYSGYNQIPMVVADRTKTAFMTESDNYYYNVMPFGLKNAGATYQRMMNKVFRGEIGDMLEARKVNMRFNPEKCTFGIRAGKFLGFYLTERGIDANPDKCRAFTEFPTPNDKMSIQTLNGMLTALSRFVAKSAQHTLHIFKLLRKKSAFEWTEECEQVIQHLKKALSEPLVLSRPDVGEVLYLYSPSHPRLYQRIEKVALALVNSARRLRYYFLAHTIVVQTDQPIKSLLVRPDMAGKMLKLSLELSEFDIRYESRKALKAQVLADFVAEMTCSPSSTDGANKWTIFVDGASNATGAGAGIILENEEGILIEVASRRGRGRDGNKNLYRFAARRITVKERITKFDSAEIQHVPREHNKQADILSKLASSKRKNGNKSVIQEILSHPSIQKPARVLDINVIGDTNYWMTPVYNYLAHGTLPNDKKEATTVKRRSCSYTILGDKLYRMGFSIPLLKCADESTADYILREIHEGINSQHLGGRSLARKALRAGYYWPTMQQDAKEHVKKCDKCQRHADMHLAPPHELKSLSSPWPFAWWGMDILGPFTRGNLQCRFLIVGVDYFTKCLEAEPLPEITSFRILRFFKRDILCRFGIPQAVVTDKRRTVHRQDISGAASALKTTGRAPRQRMSTGTRVRLKILKVNSELNTRAEPLPDEDNSGNELHRPRAIT
ncbi:hypothetical protein TSUD_218260 [Trifolium subterraneum]|uniref:Reverse transcriptase n=1 Tax=Trifolium subterraneum TaxID=3900 RepID=A0A2Z6MK25_TRISU|nr:hypothetical protein TSUD_218260 [Trifolium subterraneum]